MKGTKTYIRVPRAWWPKHWASRFCDPICQLLKTLFGHPHARVSWNKKLEAELLHLNFNIFEGWPAFVLLCPDGVATVLFVVFVDDLVIIGPEFLVDIIPNFARTSRWMHRLNSRSISIQKIVEGETITNVTFDLKYYFQGTIDEYLELANEKFARLSQHAL